MTKGHFEARKWSYRQTKEGVVVSLLIHPNDVPAELATSALGTIYMIGFAEVDPNTGDVPTREGGKTGTKEDYSTVNPSPPSPTKSKPRKWDTLPLSQRAAMLTKDPVFWNYLEDRNLAATGCDEDVADEALKAFCGVNSKAHIETFGHSERRFRSLESNFLAWKQAVQHGAA